MMVPNRYNLSEIKYALSECNDIRYAAYRTSSKLRVLQRSLLLNRITLEVVEGVCEKHQLTQIENSVRLQLSELENLLSDIFFVIRKKSESGICEESLCRSLVDTLLNVYDGNATNEIEVLSCKIFLAVLCEGKLREKHHFMYRQVADNKNGLTKEGLQLLLERLVDIVEFLGEANGFGRHFIKGTVESCFKKEHGTVWLSKESFMTWLAQDPQLLVWMTTLHRMQLSEFILHHVKCGVCKTSPVVGLRYSCLKCLAYNMCQTCFFTGKTSKKHKLNHPIQEYCLPMTAKQCTKAFLLTLKNAFTKTNDKPQYLPVISVGVTDRENVIGSRSRWSACKRPLNELQSIISNLEMESEKLIPQIETFCEKMIGNNVELRSCILRHKSQIENQIRRLKTLRNAAMISDEAEEKGKAPVASTPVVAGFSARCERKTTFSDGLEALSPIKLVLRPFADSSPRKKEEKNPGRQFVWDNYDLCHGNCFSWEEIKSDGGMNESAPTSSATAQRKQSVNDHDGDGISINRGDSDESFCLHEDSERFFREGFTWVREKSEDRAAFESVACRSHARNAEDDFADVHLHLKNALQAVRDGLARLRGPHDEREGEQGVRDPSESNVLSVCHDEFLGVHEQAEKVDSLLIDFINGIETFAGS